jgi:hypothetical protein
MGLLWYHHSGRKLINQIFLVLFLVETFSIASFSIELIENSTS